MNRKIVALSIAHFPAKPGASGGGFNEHQHSLKWTDSIMKGLQAAGVTVALTPVGGLIDKVSFINSKDCDLALEVHFNGSSNTKVSGVETLYCPGSRKGKLLADLIHKSYAPVMQCRDRGVKEGWYRMDRPYIEDYPGDVDGDEVVDYFLKRTYCPAIILEPEFMSQVDKILSQKEDACEAIVQGILNYLEANNG